MYTCFVNSNCLPKKQTKINKKINPTRNTKKQRRAKKGTKEKQQQKDAKYLLKDNSLPYGIQ